MIRALRFRLTAVCTAVTVLVLAVMAIVVLRYSENQVRAQASQRFLSDVNTACYHLRGSAVVDNSQLGGIEAAGDLYIRVETGSGPLLHVSHSQARNTLTQAALQTALAQGHQRWKPVDGNLENNINQFAFTWDGTDYYAAVCTLSMPGDSLLEVTVVQSAEKDGRQVVRLRHVFALSVAAAALCLFLFAWRFTVWASKPVEESHRKQSQFIAAASHEMRAPLAVIQVSAGALHQATPAQVHDLADTISGEGTRMKRMLSDLLFLAAADGNRLRASLRPAEPDTLLLGVSERMEALFQNRGIRLQVVLAEDLPTCLCDPDRIEQLLYILADNALRFTPDGGTVTLQAARRGRAIRFCVSDTGPGVPDGQKKLVFDRFYQADDARSSREHYGLGLSVAKEIIELHRGDISVSDAAGGGAEFSFTIPIKACDEGGKNRRRRRENF